VRTAILAAALAALSAPASAERLVTALSSETVSITSNFTGTGLVVFGTIERDAQTVARPEPYQIVVTLMGPPADIVSRQKERTLGLWINRGAEEMLGVPGFYAIASTEPLAEIASPAIRAGLGLGLDMLPINAEASAEPPVRTPFEEAFLRLMEARGLYRQEAGTVEFLSGTLFRAQIRLPANVPVGSYEATAYLFTGPTLLTTTTGELTIQKTGAEQFITDYSRNRGLVYGVASVFAACVIGWLAGILFRRD
jgi:uncharacterized protein (TIGR02186 family)